MDRGRTILTEPDKTSRPSSPHTLTHGHRARKHTIRHTHRREAGGPRLLTHNNHATYLQAPARPATEPPTRGHRHTYTGTR